MHEHPVFNADGYMHAFMMNNAQQEQDELVKFIACGDTGPVRRLEGVVIQKGGTYVLGELKAILEDADIVFANLETTFSDRGEALDRVPVFRLSPRVFSVITDAHINVVSVANNHMFDYGPESFEDTLNLFKENNIAWFGGGLNPEDACKPLIYEIKGLKLGFLGFRDTESRWYDHNGVYTDQIDPVRIIQRVKELKPIVDWTVLSLHFGLEYQFCPSPKDIELCRMFIDAGADIILGHHPHYPQGVERYKDGIIAYSLGNFIWDQNFASHTSSSYILELQISKTCIISARIIPFQMKRNYTLALKMEDKNIHKINQLSSILTDASLLDEKWYFICRNTLVQLVRYMLNTLLGRQQRWTRLAATIKESLNSRMKYVLFSFVRYCFSFKAIKYEVKRIFERM